MNKTLVLMVFSLILVALSTVFYYYPIAGLIILACTAIWIWNEKTETEGDGNSNEV